MIESIQRKIANRYIKEVPKSWIDPKLAVNHDKEDLEKFMKAKQGDEDGESSCPDEDPESEVSFYNNSDRADIKIKN